MGFIGVLGVGFRSTKTCSAKAGSRYVYTYIHTHIEAHVYSVIYIYICMYICVYTSTRWVQVRTYSILVYLPKPSGTTASIQILSTQPLSTWTLRDIFEDAWFFEGEVTVGVQEFMT